MYQYAIGQWQQALHQTLTAYLGGDYLRVRSRWAFPLQWALSPIAVYNAVVGLAYAGHILGQDIHDSAVSAFCSSLELAMESCRADPEGSLTEVLAAGYRLQDHLCQANAERQPGTVLLGSWFDEARYLRIDSGYLWPVVRLVQYIRERMRPYLALSLIHGSIGDLNYCKGYSDLDTLLVLNRDTVMNPAGLREFARLYYHSLVELYRFDPLQHHGHMVMTTIDLDSYPESWLPLATFSDAKVVGWASGKMEARIRDSQQEARSAFEGDYDYFRMLNARHWAPPDAYSLKYFLSILMLLPTRYLQAKGIFGTKRESFDLAKQSLPNAGWQVIDHATQLRAEWPLARSRVIDALSRIQGFLNVQTVRLIQRVTLERRYRESLRRFAPRYRELAAELAQQMFDDLYAGESTAMPVLKVKSTTTDCASSLSVVNLPVYRHLDEYQLARECYVDQIKEVPGVAAVYEFGSIGAPGLSDLDLVVSVADTSRLVSAIDPMRLSIDPLPFSARSLILHDALIVPESQIRFADQFLPESSLQELWPCRSCVPALAGLGAQTGLYAKAAKLVEKLFAYAVWFADTCDIQVLDARWAIAVLRSLVFSIFLTEAVTGRAPADSVTYAKAADELRAGWFQEPSSGRKILAVRDLYALGKSLTSELAESLGKFLTASGWLTPRERPEYATRVFSLQGNRVSVAFRATTEQPAESDDPSGAEFVRGVNLPWSFMQVLSLYARSSPGLARVLTVDLPQGEAGSPVKPQTNFESYLCERARLLENQTRFLLRYKFWFGSYLPGQLLCLPQRPH